MTDEYYIDLWIDLPDDEPVNLQAVAKDLRGRGWVILDASGKAAVDYGFERTKNRLHCYGVALYERDRDHFGRFQTTAGELIHDKLMAGEFHTPRPTGQAKLPSDYAKEERFEPIPESGKKKHYRDTLTGEEISYREYGKRSGKAWAIKTQKEPTPKFAIG